MTKKEIDFALATIYKEAENDRISIDQIFLGMCSAFTKLPMPHNINSKDAGAGKSYILNKTVSYFPREYVWSFIGVSTKAILHKSGKMVNQESCYWRIRRS